VVRPVRVPLATAVFHSHIHAPSLSPHLSCRRRYCLAASLAARGTECQNRCLPAMVRLPSRRGCPLYSDQPFTYDASAVTCLVSIAPDRCSLIVLPAGLPCHVQQACPGGCRHIYTYSQLLRLHPRLPEKQHNALHTGRCVSRSTKPQASCQHTQ
jgi:hypothetical protein